MQAWINKYCINSTTQISIVYTSNHLSQLSKKELIKSLNSTGSNLKTDAVVTALNKEVYMKVFYI